MNKLFSTRQLHNQNTRKFSKICSGLGWESPVGIANDYESRSRSLIPGRRNLFLISVEPRPTHEPTHLQIQWAMGALSLSIKRPALEADH
jgi:hypothetical protein